MKIWTRNDYTDKCCTHSQYYGQMLNPALFSYVTHQIGFDRMKNSNDPHFNDIPLCEWDQLVFVKEFINRNKWRIATGHRDKRSYPWSLSDQVCIAKQVARAIRDYYRNEESNDHAANYVLLANIYGTDTERRLAAMNLARRDRLGHTDQKLAALTHTSVNKYYKRFAANS